jgi:hypothetical protein
MGTIVIHPSIYSSWWKIVWASSGRLEWPEDLDTTENTLEILVTNNRGNELKLLLQGHM